MATISIEFSVASCSTSSVVRWMSWFTYVTASTVPGHLSLLLYSFCYVRIFAPLHILRHLNFQTCSDTEVFCTFDFQMCFAPQRRALFRHLNSQLPKGVRPWCVLYLWLGNVLRVQLFISHLTTWLRTRRFSEPTFRPSGATNHWKNIVFRGFPTFSRTCIFFLLTLLTLSLTLFPSVHIVGSLTSKLLSIMYIIFTDEMGEMGWWGCYGFIWWCMMKCMRWGLWWFYLLIMHVMMRGGVRHLTGGWHSLPLLGVATLTRVRGPCE